MKQKHIVYFWLPIGMMAAWTAFYVYWRQQHPVQPMKPWKHPPPTVFVWPEPKRPEDSPEVAAIRKRTEELQRQLWANQAELSQTFRDGVSPTANNVIKQPPP